MFWRKDTKRSIAIEFLDDTDLEIELAYGGIPYPEEVEGYIGEHEMTARRPHYTQIFYYLIGGKIVGYTQEGTNEEEWDRIKHEELMQEERERKVALIEGELHD